MMREFWMDADSFITPHRGPYRFGAVPQFWDFLARKADEGILGSPELVLDLELTSSDPAKADLLEKWAKPLRGSLFLPADAATQRKYNEVAEYVKTNPRFKPQWVAPFLDKADPWVVAYAAAQGGKIVAFEKPQPEARKPKVPDIAAHFGVACISVYDMLDELGFKIT
jgi:hypothetical protein